jgi:protein-S-isoprenylcysteine O-methyltransferase Ste14
MDKNNDIPIGKIIRNITIFFLIALMSFFVAGKINWYNGWLFWGITFSVLPLFYIIFSKDKDLIKERMNYHDNVKSWDRVILVFYILFNIIAFIIAPLDSGRYRWSTMPYYLVAAGCVFLVLAYLLMFIAMRANRFFSSQVRIQSDRGHKVCMEGPYRHIRHPGYAGVMLMWIASPLILGSLYAFIPGFMIVILFIIRTYLEDETLLKELDGYSDYAMKTRYRIIPYIW